MVVFGATTATTRLPTAKTSIKADDCKSCHLILAQGNDEQMTKLNAQGYDFVHIDSEYSDFSCSQCHTGAAIKN